MRTLVVYYSLTGHAEAVGQALAAALGAELEAIREFSPRRGGLGHLRSVIDVIGRRRPRIAPAHHDPAHYELVVLGAPVWARSIASPMRSYAIQHRDRLPAIGVFCTLLGEGSSKALADLAGVCRKQPLAELSVTDAEIASEGFRQKAAGFAARLLQSAPASLADRRSAAGA